MSGAPVPDDEALRSAAWSERRSTSGRGSRYIPVASRERVRAASELVLPSKGSPGPADNVGNFERVPSMFEWRGSLKPEASRQ
ncbi:hypothetical protein GCM10010289_80410 [Streptomyces violascens]|nr:hypothetical protein GCM10010289_80410 [Streptomyces violascens]